MTYPLPLTLPDNGDPRFTGELLDEIGGVLTAHGFPPADGDDTDFARLREAIQTFLYGPEFDCGDEVVWFRSGKVWSGRIEFVANTEEGLVARIQIDPQPGFTPRDAATTVACRELTLVRDAMSGPDVMQPESRHVGFWRSSLQYATGTVQDVFIKDGEPMVRIKGVQTPGEKSGRIYDIPESHTETLANVDAVIYGNGDHVIVTATRACGDPRYAATVLGARSVDGRRVYTVRDEYGYEHFDVESEQMALAEQERAS